MCNIYSLFYKNNLIIVGIFIVLFFNNVRIILRHLYFYSVLDSIDM